jgi:hypothetical protein
MRASRIPFPILLLWLLAWLFAAVPWLAAEAPATRPDADREGRSTVLSGPALSWWDSGIRFQAASDPKRPKTDLIEGFDSERSPLQTGMLDARDRAWSRKALLGSDPRCARAARELARAADAADDRYPKLCHTEDGTHLGRSECLALYCCAESDGGSCPALACASALVEGAGLEACATSPARAADGCVDEMFSKTQGKTRVLDCMEDPFDSEGEIRASCRNVLDRCPDMPLVRTTLDEARSGTIVDEQDRRVGRRIQTRTEILYDASEQRGRGGALARTSEAWEPIRIRRGPAAGEREAVPGSDRHVRATLAAGSFNGDCDPLVRCAENDDGDCVDRAMNEHFGPDRCFDDEGRLRATLRLRSDCALPGAACCEHVGLDGTGTGELFHGDDCLIDPALPATPDNLRTTLVQMIDEDAADAEQRRRLHERLGGHVGLPASRWRSAPRIRVQRRRGIGVRRLERRPRLHGPGWPNRLDRGRDLRAGHARRGSRGHRHLARPGFRRAGGRGLPRARGRRGRGGRRRRRPARGGPAGRPRAAPDGAVRRGGGVPRHVRAGRHGSRRSRSRPGGRRAAAGRTGL